MLSGDPWLGFETIVCYELGHLKLQSFLLLQKRVHLMTRNIDIFLLLLLNIKFLAPLCLWVELVKCL